MKQVRYALTSKLTGATGHSDWFDLNEETEARIKWQCDQDMQNGIVIGNPEYREKP
jgi:hypothetical protein